MKEGEQRIFDIFTKPIEHSKIIDQRIAELRKIASEVLESPERHYTQEYLESLSDTELLGLMQEFLKEIQEIILNLQKLGEYHKKYNQFNSPDVSMDLMILEEAIIGKNRAIKMGKIYKETYRILLKRGSI